MLPAASQGYIELHQRQALVQVGLNEIELGRKVIRFVRLVIFTSYAGEEFKLDGDKKVLLMREDDILAIVEG